MTKTIKIALIIVSVALLGFGAYYFLGNKADVSSGVAGVINEAPSGDTASSTSFLSTLLSLNKIKIDPTLFKSPLFLKLQDNTVPIINESGGVGRANPFAQIDIQSSSDSAGLLLPQINNNSITSTPITNNTVINNNSNAVDLKNTNQPTR